MAIQVTDSRRYKYSHEFSIKYTLPCLLGVFLLPVWLFSRSVAISTSSPGRFSLASEVGPTSKAREKRPGDEVVAI